MGLFKKIVDTFKARAHDVVDAAQDPASQARQNVREQAESIQELNNVIFGFHGDIDVLDEHLREAKEKHAKYTTGAEDALKAGNEDLAKRALQAAMEQEQEIAGLETQINDKRDRLAKMEERRDKLEAGTRQMQNEVSALAARQQAAKAESKAAQALERTVIDTSGLDSLQTQVEKEAGAASARLDRALDLTQGSTLDRDLEKVSRTTSGDDLATRLEQMKQKIGK